MRPVRVWRVGQQPVIRIRTDLGTFRTVGIPAPRSRHGMVAVVSLIPRCKDRAVQAVDQQIESLWVAVNVVVGASVEDSCHRIKCVVGLARDGCPPRYVSVQQRPLLLLRTVPQHHVRDRGVGAGASPAHVVDCRPQTPVGIGRTLGHDCDGVLSCAQAGTRARRIGQHEVVVEH